MDSLTLILKYIFNKSNLDVNFESVESMFKNGISFPMLISAIFKVNEIPKIKKTPVTKDDIKSNNDLALQFLFQNNNLIDKNCKNYKSTSNKMNLISEILTKQCFKLDSQEIINQCNLIVKPLKVHYSSEKDFLKPHNLITILSALTKGEVEKISDNQKDIYIILKKSFEKAKVPLVLDSKPINNRNKYLFYIQIQIIFDIYKESIQKVTNKDKKQKKSSFLKFFRRKDESSNSSSESTSDYSDNDDEKKNEDIQNEALLKIINFIGSKFDLSFENFEEAVLNDSIPKFVMKFLNLQEIKNVIIQTDSNEDLTKEQIENIKAVIEFLKSDKKIKKFQLLIFHFEDYKNVESSTILFYETFLNCFFMKNIKQEMYLKTVKLLCTHTSKFKDTYDEHLFTKYKIYPCLLHFLINKNLHFNFNYKKKKFNDDEVKKYFEDANVPMIINKEMIKYSKKYVSYPIFYQLQFIFDAFKQNETTSHRIVELFAGFLFELKKVEVPKINEIALNIKAKRISLNYQKQMKNKYNVDLNEQKIVKNDIKIEIQKPKKFLEMNDENSIAEMKMKVISSIKEAEEEDIIIKPESYMFNILNKPDPNFENDNGIIYNKNEFEKNKKDSQINWANEVSNIKKNIKKTSNKNESENIYFYNQKKEEAKPKLYKLFEYTIDSLWDNDTYKWNYNENNFKKFISDKKFDDTELKTPFVLLYDSYEDDLKTICSNFIDSSYPNLDDNDEKSDDNDPDKIFVYALCDRSLNKLNFIIDDKNDDKKSIYPIFVLLHIPKSKMNHPNIKIIVLKIYAYLSAVCDLNIIVLNKDHYLDQIEFFKTVLTLNSNYIKYFRDMKEDKLDDEIPLNFSIQRHSTIIGYGPHDNGLIHFKKDYKNPRFIFLINDVELHQFNNKEIDERLTNNTFFKNLFSQYTKDIYKEVKEEIKYHFINVNNPNTYEYFLNSMNDMLIARSVEFKEIKEKFWGVELDRANVSEFYLQIANTHDFTFFEKVFYQFFSKREKWMFSSNDEEEEEEEENEADSDSKSFLFLYNYIYKYIFTGDYVVMNKYNKISTSYEHKECSNLKIRELLRENLKKISDSYLFYMNQIINQKPFWNFEQLDIMIDSYKNFLKNEYFSIIKNLFNEELVEIAFQCHFDILEDQILEDKKRILGQIMKPFIDKIKIKNCTKFHDLRNSIKEGTNYAMKETENLKEVKVAVQINKDLKSEIPQDF